MNSAQHRRLEEVDAEQLIGALAGVVSAHVVTGPAGAISEIHVLATPELHPKQVVRNVESALSAGLGIQVDRRVVSVAQIRTAGANGERDGRDQAGVVALPSGEAAREQDATSDDEARSGNNRLEYVRFEARRDAERCTCRVTLRDDDDEVAGEGEGPDTASGRAQAAARAVFDAIGAARPELRIELDGAVISSSRGRSFVIVSAHTLLGRNSVPLAGAAPLTRSPEEAGILAALQASNRWSG